MGVKPGYKRTEVGVIPEEWEIRPFLSIVRIANGQVDPRHEPYRSMTLVAPDHIESGTGRLLDKKTAAEQGAVSGKYVFGPHDVLYSKIRPYLRKATLANFHGLCSADMYPLRPAPDISPGFVLPLVLGERFSAYAESVSARSGMPKINRAELAEFLTAVPPIQEQRAIATALSDIDGLLTQLDRLIAKKRDIKQAAMQQLLTGKTRLPGFGGAWRSGTVGDVVEALEAGVSVNSMDDPPTPGAPSVLKTSAVSAGKFLPEECKRITAADIPRARINPLAKTILISRMNTPDLVGEVAYVPVNHRWLFLPDRLWMTRFKPGARVDARWLAYLLSSRAYQQQIKAAATGTSDSMKNISKDSLLSIPVPFPEHEEQTAIATVLSDLDAELAAFEARRDKTRALKQGMMQELLTGRTRLI